MEFAGQLSGERRTSAHFCFGFENGRQGDVWRMEICGFVPWPVEEGLLTRVKGGVMFETSRGKLELEHKVSGGRGVGITRDVQAAIEGIPIRCLHRADNDGSKRDGIKGTKIPKELAINHLGKKFL